MIMRIAHLYPDLLNLYGDRGNVMTLAARCRWRGIECVTERVSLGADWDPAAADIVFFGGGSDREQGILAADLGRRAESLGAALAGGLVLLAVCGGLQMLGGSYRTPTGEKYPGLGLLDLYTEAGRERFIGDVRADLTPETAAAAARACPQAMPLTTLVGFENHGGRTWLGDGLAPLARVRPGAGAGNNGRDGGEGVRWRNVFGTYLHGPFLPKNPHIADLLLSLALERRGEDAELPPLDDREEIAAHKARL
ncbi:MAG: glutamine amidotransferase [Gracilibacteraceae bacterium]|jgi:CobQ-like glutamine amidotransferase family enzyme|nr:glutamine amidotransferase [Gracilibacteraceae bacterium]